MIIRRKINSVASYDVRGDEVFTVSLDCPFQEFKDALDIYEKDRSKLSYYLTQNGETYKIFAFVSHHNIEAKKSVIDFFGLADDINGKEVDIEPQVDDYIELKEKNKV